MNKKSHAVLSIGTSSVLVVFILLSLVTFATLSIVSANADYILTRKTADRVSDYYEANNAAEATLSRIDTILLNSYSNTNDSAVMDKEFYTTAAYSGLSTIDGCSIDVLLTEDGTSILNVSYQEDVSDSQVLFVKLEVLYPGDEESSGRFYKILNWNVTNTHTWEADDTLNVYDGSTLFSE